MAGFWAWRVIDYRWRPMALLQGRRERRPNFLHGSQRALDEQTPGACPNTRKKRSTCSTSSNPDSKFAPVIYKAVGNTRTADDLEQADRIAFGGTKRWRGSEAAGKNLEEALEVLRAFKGEVAQSTLADLEALQTKSGATKNASQDLEKRFSTSGMAWVYPGVSVVIPAPVPVTGRYPFARVRVLARVSAGEVRVHTRNG
ncbi:hypothetical protein BU15DRAFT_65300 [Melanogaster broomeanus]|nr:hypothetical protein BU15DRAFT_65300 [Melanogaster broomeanus]